MAVRRLALPAETVDSLLVSLLPASGGWLGIALGVAATLALALASVLAKVLTPPAAAVAAAFGIVSVLVGGWPFLALLILFVLGGSLATRFRYEEKRARKVAEGKQGERGVRNVLSHIVVPLGVVILFRMPDLLNVGAYTPFVYTAALACGTADTFASEFGVLGGKAVSILGGGPVKPGTNGGVSLVGEIWAFVGSLVTVGVGAALFVASGYSLPLLIGAGLWFAGGTFLGFLGCQVDSLLGATLENRGYLGKGGTNFLAMLITALLAVGMYALWV
jgi:uncharacterized protein (TIGR00297 family)